MTDRDTKRAPTILEDIKQSMPFRSRSQEAYVALLRTADEAKRFATLPLESAGVTLQQYNVLRILRGAGTTGLPCRDIGDRMVTRVPDVTRLLDRLTTDGLVSRERASDDRRVVLTQITSQGRQLVDSLDEPVERLAKESLGHMSQHELHTLSRLLEKARNPER